MRCLNFLPLILLIILSSKVLSQDIFDIESNCDPQDQVCNKIEQEFVNAGKIISNNLILNAKILVELIYEPLDDDTFGQTTPVLRIHDSPDTVQRLYPTALLKQLNITFEPDFVDIQVSINSNANNSYWFPGDPDIQSTQIDVSELALHELIHGIGFTSTWDFPEDQKFINFLTPRLNGLEDNGDPEDPIIFDGFFETVFDGFLVYIGSPTRNFITNITNSINSFTAKGTEFDNMDALNSKLLETQQQNVELMLTYATTKSSLGFLPTGSQDAIILDTSNPEFDFASSISHVSQDDYENTTEFLMTPHQKEGVTLQAQIQQTGNTPGGGIGPNLRSILGTLGYTINPNPPNNTNSNFQ
ncbi:sequence orphan [Gigaspora margarita]|uniref:Sequence orphan n=1 Tax=Gigaspora margarita TaxID=4874 RepID=A0A8H4A1R7_GIGMA|nr:sequence orphan [Gigaspora margarita]